MVKNYMEDQVAHILHDELTEHPEKYHNFCKCSACIAAVQAAALNHLKPFYITGITGEVFGEYRGKDMQNYSDVLVAVARGIEEVLAGDPNRHMTRQTAPG